MALNKYNNLLTIGRYYTLFLYITNWSFYYKIGIVFAV